MCTTRPANKLCYRFAQSIAAVAHVAGCCVRGGKNWHLNEIPRECHWGRKKGGFASCMWEWLGSSPWWCDVIYHPLAPNGNFCFFQSMGQMPGIGPWWKGRFKKNGEKWRPGVVGAPKYGVNKGTCTVIAQAGTFPRVCARHQSINQNVYVK